MLEKIISGGQAGADVGGLLFAKAAGLFTGGWMPNGWETEDGPRPEYKEQFGMQEHPMLGYAVRTEANARDSDATVRFASNFKSPGEICTLKNITKYKKHHFDVNVEEPQPEKELAEWLLQRKIKVLNVAGNRETTHPGIRDFVIGYLGRMYKELKSLEIVRLENELYRLKSND